MNDNSMGDLDKKYTKDSIIGLILTVLGCLFLSAKVFIPKLGFTGEVGGLEVFINISFLSFLFFR